MATLNSPVPSPIDPRIAEPLFDLCAPCPGRGQAVCAGLSAEELRRLAELVQIQRLDAGQPLFAEGEEAVFLFNIAAGMIKLYKLLPDGRRQITGFLMPGDFLGLMFADRYPYTAETVTSSVLCRFQRRRLEALLDTCPQMHKRLFGLASSELAGSHDQMLLLGRKTAREKICSFLDMLERRARRVSQPTTKISIIQLPMSRADIADYLGLTTETVSRTLTWLKTRGVISLLDGNRVSFTRQDTLRELAEAG
ncbi:Nitrogen fixation regulation protein FixK [uncultured Gammaproteobacteria bacterium]